MQSITQIFDTVHVLQTYGYLGMFIIAFLESGVFFLLPGDSLLFSAGILASQGYINIFITMSVFFIGSFLGSLFGYYIGDKLEDLRKTKLGAKYLHKIFSEKHISESHEYFQKRGAVTILFCRFIPIVRTFVPIIAGIGSMNYRLFVIYNFIGAAFWSLSVTGLGYFLGKEFPQLQYYLEYVFASILIVTVFPVILKIYKKYNKK